MKRFTKLGGLLLVVVLIGGFGLWKYMEAGDQGRAAEVAADAMVNVANAAAEWASDRSTHEVTIVNLMGNSRGPGIDGPVVIEARLAVKGGANLSDLCGALPRVHDAINAVLADRVGSALRAGANLTQDSFASYGDVLRDRLNRVVAAGAVTDAQVILRSARNMGEHGCNDAQAKRADAAKH